MPKLPPVSISFRRRLTPREIAAISIGLELLARHVDCDELGDIRVEQQYFDALPNDVEIRDLGFELRTAEKVKVCRSTQRPQ